jgi:hypothetical protein
MLYYTIIISIHFLMWHIMHACYFHSFLDVAHHDVVVEIKKSLQCIVSTFYGRYAVIIFCGLCSQNFFLPHFFFSIPREYFFFSPADKMRTVCSDTEELVDSWELKKRTRTKKFCPSPQFGPYRGIGRFSLHAEFAWNVTDTMKLYSIIS